LEKKWNVIGSILRLARLSGWDVWWLPWWVGYPQAMKAISLRRRGGAHDSALRSNGAGRDPRNPGRAVTKGMKADFRKSVDGRAEKVTVLKRSIIKNLFTNYLNKM